MMKNQRAIGRILRPRGYRERVRARAQLEDEGGGARVVFGVEPVRELIAASPSAINTLYVRRGAENRFAREIEAVKASGGRVASVEERNLERLASSETRHQGLVAAVREYRYAALEEILGEKPDPLLVIDGVTDPRNLGAILRAAECAGTHAAVLARNRTASITPVVIKASAGAWAHVKIARCTNVVQALEALKSSGYWTAALAPGGDVSIYELDTTRRLALVVGSEGSGIRMGVKRAADFIVGIPMHGRVGSLNVSVAAALALFEIARRRAS